MPDARSHPITFGEGVRVWASIALQSFGGPAGQIAVMHRSLVEQRRWVSEQRFLHALNYCMLLPGPEAQQLATYMGWLLHGTLGGLVAGLLFVLPGFLSILALSILYVGYRDTAVLEAVFFGLKPAVLAVVIEAVIRIGKRSLQNRARTALAAAAFIAIFIFAVPFPFVILGALVAGLVGGRLLPESFLAPLAVDGTDATRAIDDAAAATSPPSLAQTMRTILLWVAIWFTPLVVLALILGPDHTIISIGKFFSQVAVVTFGGAYAVLAYVAQQAVETYGWLRPGEMLDGLGMAETTPGPLIQVVQFVGFLAAYREPGSLPPLLAGVIASLLVTWVTFTPSFLFVFAGAPYIEHLRGRPAFGAALSGITAAVVGVILNLAVWFALHVLFGVVHEWRRFGMRILLPEPRTLDAAALVIAVAAFLALFRFRKGMLPTLGGAAVAGLIWRLLLTR